METNTSITKSFEQSISVNSLELGIDTAEVVLDSFMQDGILKEIPLVKYAVSAYKIVDDLKGRYYVRKLREFIISFNSGLASQEEVERRKAKILSKNRDSELAYITIMIDRYLDFKKPMILAKIYLAYLDNKITWDEFCVYAEIVDKLLLNDLNYLMKNQRCTTKNNIVPPELLRLSSVGLMNGYQNNSPFEGDGRGGIAIFGDSFNRVIDKEKIYEITDFGEKLIELLS